MIRSNQTASARLSDARPGENLAASPVFAAAARRGVTARSGSPGRVSASVVDYGRRLDDRGSMGLAHSGVPPEPDPIRRDEVLMATVAEGDHSAFAVLARAESPRLLRFTRSLLAPAEAEEVVQEALLRLWQQAETWQPKGRVSTWLHHVAYRLCIDRLRRRRPSIGIDEVQDDLEDPSPAPDQRRRPDLGSSHRRLRRCGPWRRSEYKPGKCAPNLQGHRQRYLRDRPENWLRFTGPGRLPHRARCEAAKGYG